MINPLLATRAIKLHRSSCRSNSFWIDAARVAASLMTGGAGGLEEGIEDAVTATVQMSACNAATTGCQVLNVI